MRSERGQSMTEYVLLLAVIVLSIALLAGTQLGADVNAVLARVAAAL